VALWIYRCEVSLQEKPFPPFFLFPNLRREAFGGCRLYVEPRLFNRPLSPLIHPTIRVFLRLACSLILAGCRSGWAIGTYSTIFKHAASGDANVRALFRFSILRFVVRVSGVNMSTSFFFLGAYFYASHGVWLFPALFDSVVVSYQTT